MTNIHQVTPDILNAWLEANQVILFDVRETSEYIAEHIQQAINLPLAQVSSDTTNLPGLQHKKLVFHCKTGKRSMTACTTLKDEQLPFDIWNLEGGIVAWKEYGLPTVAK